MTVSVGFESGSDRVLKILNKECTVEFLNRVGDDLERAGKPAPVFWANIMLAIPGETREDAFKTMRMDRRGPVHEGLATVAARLRRAAGITGPA